MSIIDTILKAFVGDKAKKDVKALQPLVDKIKSHEAALEALSHDELRNKTALFKNTIRERIEDLQEQIAGLKKQVEESDDIDLNESLYGQIDQLEDQVYERTEQTLEEILPEAFAVIKETAKRFAANSTLTVQASEFDRQLSANADYVKLDGEQAVWSNSWDAAGKEVTWDMVHYDVQLIGGIVLHQGKIARCRPGRERPWLPPCRYTSMPFRGKGFTW